MLDGPPGFFTPRTAAALSLSAGHGRGHELVRHLAVAEHPGKPGRFRPHQFRRDAFQRRDRQHSQRQLRLFRFDHPYDPAGAHHRKRGAAARLSTGRGGRRALLGRRPRLQHAAAMGGGGRHAPGHARIPGRPVERARRDAEGPERRHGAAEGNSVFEPDTRQHRPVQGRFKAVRCALANVLEKVPPELLDSEDGKLLQAWRIAESTRSFT